MSKLISIKLVKFGVVGVGGLLIDFFVTWLCKEKLKWNKYVANALGFSVAVINNFLLNKYWVFQQFTKTPISQFLQFVIISILGLLINTGLLYILTKKIKANFYVLKLVVIAIVFIWNYTVNFLFTFK
jgi:putative flippase GtrA